MAGQNQTWPIKPTDIPPFPACRSTSLQCELWVRPCADHPGGPGLSSVSGFYRSDGWDRTRWPAAARRGPGPDDEAFIWAGRTDQGRWGGRTQRTAEADEVLERPRPQCRRGRGRTFPALMRMQRGQTAVPIFTARKEVGCFGPPLYLLWFRTKKAKTVKRKKKRAISLLSLLFIFLDRIVTAAAEMGGGVCGS